MVMVLLSFSNVIVNQPIKRSIEDDRLLVCGAV
jgi:hypothetical protein